MNNQNIIKIFITRPIDSINTNAQCLNAKALLARFKKNNFKWIALRYEVPDESVTRNTKVKIIKLWRKHLWYVHMILTYQKSVQAIFYPGIQKMDYIGLKIRNFFGRKVPIIATLEGFAFDENKWDFARYIGHPIYPHSVPLVDLKRMDEIYSMADHIIAISPLLARVGTKMYGDKFSVLPLGINSEVFFPPKEFVNNIKTRVICVGSLQKRKRPDLFLKLAQKFTDAEFTWYGSGEMMQELIEFKTSKNIDNLFFKGNLSPEEIAIEMRKSDLFVLPAESEGVPKVTQEAAACALPMVIFGFYEAPTVIDGENGFVVWNDEQFCEKVGELIQDKSKAREMGLNGAEMAKHWDWNEIAPRWEEKIAQLISIH